MKPLNTGWVHPINESLRTDAPSSREEFIEEWRRGRDISFYCRERRAAAAAVSTGAKS
jgi:hypothetical protein